MLIVHGSASGTSGESTLAQRVSLGLAPKLSTLGGTEISWSPYAVLRLRDLPNDS